MPKRSGPLLGFDFGMKRIGVAIGQPVTQTASPLMTLSAVSGIPDKAEMQRLFETWSPSACVIGYPLDKEGVEGLIAKCAKKFANRLHADFRCPVHLADEYLTTQLARKIRSEHGMGTDALSAALILEAWIQAQFNLD